MLTRKALNQNSMKDKQGPQENEFVKAYGNEPIWLNWRLEERDQGGDKKLTKVPYQANGQYASSTDPTTWTSYPLVDAARASFITPPHNQGGVGVVFEALNIVAVDIDHVIEDGVATDARVVSFLDACETYVELSPSETGIHAFFKLNERYDPVLKRTPKAYKLKGYPAAEIYSSGRYFTFTGNTVANLPVRRVTPAELERILSTLGFPWPSEEPPVERPLSSILPSLDVNVDLDVGDRLERMFSSRSGEAIRRLWDGDTSDYAGDHSAADLALCSHLAFWLGRDPAAVEKAWLSSPLGKRKKTARKDYRTRTIEKAISGTTEVYSGGVRMALPTLPTLHALLTMDSSKIRARNIDEVLAKLDCVEKRSGVTYPINEHNLSIIISSDEALRGTWRFNEFTNSIQTSLRPDGTISSEWADLDDVGIGSALKYIQHAYHPHFSNTYTDRLLNAVKGEAHLNRVNPVRDYFESLKWDGVPRLNSWLYHTFHTADDPLHQAMGANWLKGLVSRVIRPGCKFDFTLVLEGEQGWRKTTSLAVLGGDGIPGQGWHVETIAAVGLSNSSEKDFAMMLANNVIIEMAEGATLNYTDSVKLKGILTRTVDEVRLPYEKGWSKMKRHCVFAMTTNESEYLKDDTGNRRFLPVKLEAPANVDWLAENRDQLFAEAYHRVVVLKETMYEFPDSELVGLQKSRLLIEGHEEALISWYANLSEERRKEGLTVLEIYNEVWLAGAPLGRDMPGYKAKKIGGLLREVLALEKTQKQVHGDRNMRWFATPATEKIIRRHSVSALLGVDARVEAEPVDPVDANAIDADIPF